MECIIKYISKMFELKEILSQQTESSDDYLAKMAPFIPKFIYENTSLDRGSVFERIYSP